MDLEKFEQFKRKFDPSFTAKNPGSNNSNQGPSIKWPQGPGGSGGSKMVN